MQRNGIQGINLWNYTGGMASMMIGAAVFVCGLTLASVLAGDGDKKALIQFCGHVFLFALMAGIAHVLLTDGEKLLAPRLSEDARYAAQRAFFALLPTEAPRSF